jgi:peptidoglycan hydrolase CwlO-like protein
MDNDVEKALKAIQKDLKDVQDAIDSVKDTINGNVAVLWKQIDVITGHTKSIADPQKRINKLEKKLRCWPRPCYLPCR